MELIGVLGIICGVIAIIYFALRNLNITIAALIASFIVIVTNQMAVFDTLLGTENSFIAAAANFIVENFAIFILGAILGAYMEKSNATMTIAEFALSITGTEKPFRVLAGITIITAFLSYGGISSFVIIFTLFPMVRPIFKKLNINWELLYIPFYLGGCTFVGSMLPGSPAIKNYVPTNTLGTPLTAAADLGILATIVTLIFGFIYMKWMLHRSLKKGETFYSYLKKGDVDFKEKQSTEKIRDLFKPSIGRSIAPMISLMILILTFSDVENIIIIALTSAILLAALLYNKYLPSQMDVLNRGSTNAIGSVFAISSSIGFGTVLISAPTFDLIQNSILSLPGSPLIGLSVLTSTLSGMMGTGIGPIGIVMNNYIQAYVEMGVPPEVLHRVVVIASGIFSCMPHTGMVISTNHVSGLSYHNGFKHAFIIVNGGHLLALITVLIATPLLY